jgi:acetyl-CoA C-acetyltransferase
MIQKVYIVSAVRTPLGSFGGALSSIPATKLGSIAIRGAIDKIKINPDQINEVYMGNVLQANTGQAPARQAAMGAGIPSTVPATTINKVCSSGMKAVILAAQSILLRDNEIVVAGGMENMSQVPYYSNNMRWGSKLGDVQLIDGLVRDGLTDVYNKYHMGNAAELCAKEYKISRADQDNFAIKSYKRSTKAWNEGKFEDEIVAVEVPQRRGEPVRVDRDEEFINVNLEKLPNLRPVFQKEGSVTAANASTLNDGASALILASEAKVKELGLTPIAEILSYADAAQEPEWFTTAPSKAISIAINKAALKKEDVDFYELNEAFSVVGIVNSKILAINSEKVNVNGGSVSLGHPLGCSGARIITTLINVLKQNGGTYGAAGICNGGGGASAVVIKNC